VTSATAMAHAVAVGPPGINLSSVRGASLLTTPAERRRRAAHIAELVAFCECCPPPTRVCLATPLRPSLTPGKWTFCFSSHISHGAGFAADAVSPVSTRAQRLQPAVPRPALDHSIVVCVCVCVRGGGSRCTTPPRTRSPASRSWTRARPWVRRAGRRRAADSWMWQRTCVHAPGDCFNA
jgi:hypothetical protein